MCVTGPLLWNTTWLHVFRCGHLMRLSPRVLGVRAVDRPVTAVDMTMRKNLRRLAARARADAISDLTFPPFPSPLRVLVDAEDDHERLEQHPVHAEREQDEDGLDDDQHGEAAAKAALLEADDEEDQAEQQGPGGQQDVEDLDDLRRDERVEAEVEQRPDESLLAAPLPCLRPRRHTRDALPLRRARAARGSVAGRLVALVLLAGCLGARSQIREGLVLCGVALVLRHVRLVLRAEGRRRVSLALPAGVPRRRRVTGLLPGWASLGQRLIRTIGLVGRFWRLSGHRVLHGGGPSRVRPSAGGARPYVP
jgi:hypothetical protein